MISEALRRRLDASQDTLETGKFYPHYHSVMRRDDDGTAIIDGRECLDVSTNSYLSVSQHPKVIAAANAANSLLGVGSGGSRITSGTTELHQKLERRIAQFKGAEDAVLFSSGYLANTGIIVGLAAPPLRGAIRFLDPSAMNHLNQPVDLIFDELVHASIIDGIRQATARLSGGTVEANRFKHRDMGHLQKRLESSSAPIKVIMTDGVFSLHGRLAPLDKIVALANQYGAAVYVDDAHGAGLFGAGGRGTAKHFGVEDGIDFNIGTLSKAFGVEGGYITGTHQFCEEMRVQCRTHVYQTSMPPGNAAALLEVFDLVEREPWRRTKVLEAADTINRSLKDMGFDTLGCETQILPVRFFEEQKAKAATEILLERGLFAPAYFAPAVGVDEAMVRVNICYAIAKDEAKIEQLLDALAYAGRTLGVI